MTQQLIQQRIDRGSDPSADAAEAARRNSFGLITLGQRDFRPVGVTCFTPYWHAPEALITYNHGDVMDERTSAWYSYARHYNRAMVDQIGYPYADLCRGALEGDKDRDDGLFPITEAARTVAAPPATMHQAARCGSADELRVFLRQGEIDALDGLGMTPLAWAIARDNLEAVDLLLERGASPWVGGPSGHNAMFVAAQLGRPSYFMRMERQKERPFNVWPNSYLVAAVSGGDAAIVTHMLAQPHEQLRVEALRMPLPATSTLEPILKEAPQLANALLWKTTDHPGDRIDLVRLAIDHGAEPNGKGSPGHYGTVLGAYANGFSPRSVEIVETLLNAGADPNLISHFDRPIWIAVRTLRLGLQNPNIDQRAAAIVERLLQAGADINLPNDQGVPLSWMLLFPTRWDREKLDATFVTPSLLEMLVQNGLDLNARWQGKRLLPLAQAQAGTDSELVTTLRRLGARH